MFDIILWGLAILIGSVVLVQVAIFLIAVLVRFVRARRRAARALSPGIAHECSGDPRVVVTLVHGTWAPRADWTFAESELCTQISADIGGVLFHRFCWSGRNSIRARRYATWRFAHHMRRTLRSFPRARHILIAHSHGGNVVLGALRPWLADRLCGVVMLATPVIVARQRKLDRTSRHLLPSLAITPLLLAAFLGSTATLILSLLWLGVMVMCFLYWPEILHRLESILPVADYARIPRAKVMFVRATADEASGAITAAHMLSWVVTKTVTLPIRFYGYGAEQLAEWRRWARQHALLVGGIVAAWFLIWFGILQLAGPDLAVLTEDMGEWAALAMGVPLAIAVVWVTARTLTLILIYVVLPLALVPFFVVAALAGLAVGPEMIAAAVVREVTVEPCPPGTWSVTVVPDPASEDGAEESFLQHSVVYRSPTAIAIMVNWIRDRLALPR